ncbi:MAG: response regulator transcription factor [Deltaproteobacteria bacterium]|nr:response regulator transcription factor [Deltaproteobacteria bacterium]
MERNAKIMIVEDDRRLAELTGELLEQNGYTVSTEGNGEIAIERIHLEEPDLIILDINLPGLDGFTVCRRVRPRFKGRILMLTARGEEIDELFGLEAGADDYLAKPVAPQRLLVRVRAILRRTERQPEMEETASAPVRSGNLAIYSQRRVVELDGVPLGLSSAEFDLLWFLARNIGRPLTRETIYRELKGCAYDGVDRSIDLRVSKLRRCLGDDPTNPRWIKTVRGSGYLLAKY